MQLSLAFLGILMIMVGMFLVTLALRRSNATGIILIGPIPIIISNKPYLFVIPIIAIAIIILLMII